MVYTVKSLSELAKVSVKTLYHYDAIGLLKPAYYGENGYRYYEEKELLTLQQILFFKTLGLSLKKIKKIIGKSDFDTLSALYLHKEAITNDRDNLNRLLKTIDKTIKHLKGRSLMKDKEMFDGFSSNIKKADKSKSYYEAEDKFLSLIKTTDEDLDEKEAFEKASEIFKAISKLIDTGYKPIAKEVQEHIQNHFELTQKYHGPSIDAYKALATLYLEHPAFIEQLQMFHQKLSSFMYEAMTCFLEKKQS